jgi:hypothetical protein
MFKTSSVPSIPSGNPGKFSIRDVVVNCPPAGPPEIKPSNNRGSRFARAAYRAAVSPAGPDPIITTFSTMNSSGDYQKVF